MMRSIDASEVERALDYPSLIDRLREAFRVASRRRDGIIIPTPTDCRASGVQLGRLAGETDAANLFDGHIAFDTPLGNGDRQGRHAGDLAHVGARAAANAIVRTLGHGRRGACD